jgi:hypothetical protein
MTSVLQAVASDSGKRPREGANGQDETGKAEDKEAVGDDDEAPAKKVKKEKKEKKEKKKEKKEKKEKKVKEGEEDA